MKKNICLLVLLLFVVSTVYSQKPNTLTSKEIKEGWILLFDGVSTKGWTTTSDLPVPAAGGGWEVINGCISTVLEGKGGDIITVSEYSNFELSVDFKITTGCNTGVKYFFTNYEKGGKLGMEYQILDDIYWKGKYKDNWLCGSFYDVLPADSSKKKLNPPGEWNTICVVVKGKKVEHWLNGIKILSFERGSKQYTDGVALSKFNQTEPAFGMVDKGHILLQYHGGVASFRNIKIKINK
jgi:hypothetical protein